MPFSAIFEAKGILQSNTSWAKKTLENMLSESDKIEKNFSEEEKELAKCNAFLASIISYIRNKDNRIKGIRNRIRLLRYRARNLSFKINKRLDYMPTAKFKKKNYMKITGRAQGKCCNNLFKYDYTDHMMEEE